MRARTSDQGAAVTKPARRSARRRNNSIRQASATEPSSPVSRLSMIAAATAERSSAETRRTSSSTWSSRAFMRQSKASAAPSHGGSKLAAQVAVPGRAISWMWRSHCLMCSSRWCTSLGRSRGRDWRSRAGLRDGPPPGGDARGQATMPRVPRLGRQPSQGTVWRSSVRHGSTIAPCWKTHWTRRIAKTEPPRKICPARCRRRAPGGRQRRSARRSRPLFDPWHAVEFSGPLEAHDG